MNPRSTHHDKNSANHANHRTTNRRAKNRTYDTPRKNRLRAARLAARTERTRYEAEQATADSILVSKALGCPNPEYAAYPDEITARFQLAAIRERFAGADQLPVRYYRCGCGRWHVSSKPLMTPEELAANEEMERLEAAKAATNRRVNPFARIHNAPVRETTDGGNDTNTTSTEPSKKITPADLASRNTR